MPVWLPGRWIISRTQDTRFHSSLTKCPVVDVNACLAFDVQTSVVKAIKLATRNRPEKAAFPSSKSFRIHALTCVMDGSW